MDKVARVVVAMVTWLNKKMPLKSGFVHSQIDFSTVARF